jgi:hypothetical protein
MMLRPRSNDCAVLLDFEEVNRRLQLGPRTDIGTHEIPVSQIIGSVGRAHEFDGCFRPRSDRLRRVLTQIRATRPDAADTPILVYQVDQAYFVVDGHKRLALAVEDGRRDIDAEIGRFESRFRLERGDTIQDVRATEAERRFREITALDAAVPDARFPLGDPDGFLELAESVKAHAYDLSRERGTLVGAADAARHWYDLVYLPALDIARGSGVAGALSSCSAAELFLVLRRGIRDAMQPGWRVPPTAVVRGVANMRAAAPGRIPAAVARATRRRQAQAHVLDVVNREADRSDEGADPSTNEPVAGEQRPPTIVRRPRRQIADAND